MKKALLVIDFINGIAQAGSCADYLLKHPEVIKNTNYLIGSFREQDQPVIFIRLAFTQDYAGLPKFAPYAQTIKENKSFLLDHDDTSFIDELDIKEDDIVLNKKYGDPF